MERPKVNQIQSQRVESDREVTGYEAEELLRKYGYSQEYTREDEIKPIDKHSNLSFEEMVKQEELKRKREEDIKRKKMYAPKPITFDGSSGYDSKTTYGSDEDTGIGFKIEISTDMRLPKY